MIRGLLALVLWMSLSVSGLSQGLGVVARVLPDDSGIRDLWRGRTELSLGLSRGVPYRVFVVDNPARLVVDFREVDFAGLESSAVLPAPGRIGSVQFGMVDTGWSRFVATLTEPMLPVQIGLAIDEATGEGHLKIELTPVSPEQFADVVDTPEPRSWPTVQPASATVSRPPDDDRFVVVLDPGHGGVDPGAVNQGFHEKTLMLTLARELREMLRREGIEHVYLTREEDVFVSLPQRVAFAHQMRADLFISLHADAIQEGRARGATVYTLAEQASDQAAMKLAAEHDRADIIAGLDLTETDEEIILLLSDLARQETRPRTESFADILLRQIRQAGAPVHVKPRRGAAFSVLKSPDIPSVLLEVGFMSDARDLKNLRNAKWRQGMIRAITRAVLAWQGQDAAKRMLVRQ